MSQLSPATGDIVLLDLLGTSAETFANPLFKRVGLITMSGAPHLKPDLIKPFETDALMERVRRKAQENILAFSKFI